MQFKVWEKRHIGGEFGAASEVPAKTPREAATLYCKSRGYRDPQDYMTGMFRVQVADGGRIHYHYIKVQKIAAVKEAKQDAKHQRAVAA